MKWGTLNSKIITLGGIFTSSPTLCYNGKTHLIHTQGIPWFQILQQCSQLLAFCPLEQWKFHSISHYELCVWCARLSFILTLLSFSLCTIAPAHPCHFLPSWRNHSFSSWNNPSLGCPYTFGLTDPGRGWTSAMWSQKPAQPMNLRLQALQPPKVPTLKILHWIQQQLGGGRRKSLPSVTDDRELRCHTKIRSPGPEEELKKPV